MVCELDNEEIFLAMTLAFHSIGDYVKTSKERGVLLSVGTDALGKCVFYMEMLINMLHITKYSVYIVLLTEHKYFISFTQ